MAFETAFGALLGSWRSSSSRAVQLGGELAGIQMGFGLVNLIDPQTNGAITVVAQWQQLLALLVFLALDGHHLLLRGAVDELPRRAAGAPRAERRRRQAVFALAGERLRDRRCGSRRRCMVALLLTNAALGVLARTIPQLNVFIVGFPLTVGVGLVMLGGVAARSPSGSSPRASASSSRCSAALARGFAHG